MVTAFRDDDSSLADEWSVERADIEFYRTFERAPPEPGWSVLDSLAAAGRAEQETADDELVNHEDPYLQNLLGNAEDD